MVVSIANPTLTYLSIYETTGERVTSYVTGAHGDTVEELLAKAKVEYPDKVHVVQDALTYNKALQGDLLYKMEHIRLNRNQQKKRSEKPNWRRLILNMLENQ